MYKTPGRRVAVHYTTAAPRQLCQKSVLKPGLMPVSLVMLINPEETME